MSDQIRFLLLGFLAYSSGYKSVWAVFRSAGIISRSIKSDLILSMHLLFSRVTWTPHRALRFDAIRFHMVPTVCRDLRHVQTIW